MDIGAGITFGNGVGISKQPVIYLVGTLSASGINESATCICVDSSGNFYVGGNTSGGYALISKYDSNGVIQWKKQFTTEWYAPVILGIAVDNLGGLYIAGTSNTKQFTVSSISKISSVDGSAS